MKPSGIDEVGSRASSGTLLDCGEMASAREPDATQAAEAQQQFLWPDTAKPALPAQTDAVRKRFSA